ncbi:hypothetical protein JQ580_24830 [Bradyrhizobium japonicum]|uniref:hypothetical protein n=1 Tax=Bradyrhizobium japonicum TaxID=375 RepID=UPI001BAA27EA|nr:hypothetical protein [Bradyrhizobium japonicum]MBR0993954.1 hypothetical protein [Bradyrhizobium japonicum]
MPDEIFRGRPLDDAFQMLLATETGNKSRNLPLLVRRLIGYSCQALAPQTILARDLVTKNLDEPIGFSIFWLATGQSGRGGQRERTEQSDPEHSQSHKAGIKT